MTDLRVHHRRNTHLRQWLCDVRSSTSLHEWAKTQAFSGGLNGGFAGFTFGMTAGTSSSEMKRDFESWQTSRCNDDIADFSNEQLATYLSRIQDTTAPLAAWSACVAEVVGAQLSCRRAAGEFAGGTGAVQGLFMIAPERVPADGEPFAAQLSWCGLVGSTNASAAEVAAITATGASCEGNIVVGDSLCPGDQLVHCTRTSSGPVTITVEVTVRPPGTSPQRLAAGTWLDSLCGRRGQVCCNSNACAFPADECFNGECVPRCTGATRRCGDATCEVESAASCGDECETCAAPGGATPLCQNHDCTWRCGSGLSPCGYECVDFDRDPEHCGACYRRVRADQICEDGEPACRADQILCDGVCKSGVCVDTCDGVDNDGDGSTDEGGVCNTVAIDWFQTACSGCLSASGYQCQAGEDHSNLLYTTSVPNGTHLPPGAPDPREGVLIRGGLACKGSYTVSFYKTVNCSGTGSSVVRSVSRTCSQEAEVNFNCWDGDGDGSGDFDGNVRCIRVTTSQ